MDQSWNGLLQVWSQETRIFSDKRVQIQADYVQKLNQLLINFYLPGPSYQWVVDFVSKVFEYMSPNVLELIDIDPNELSIRSWFDCIHPDDRLAVVRKEKLIARFLSDFLKPEDLLHYKCSYLLRLRAPDGGYKMFLHQSIAASLDDEDRISKTIGFHADISHIARYNDDKVSFLGINGRPSYLGISNYRDLKRSKQLYHNPLTLREAQVVRCTSEGLLSKQIADRLHISYHTVRTHKKNILEKTRCKSMTEVVSRSIKEGWI